MEENFVSSYYDGNEKQKTLLRHANHVVKYYEISVLSDLLQKNDYFLD